jgi:hypothetical protein
MPTPPWIQKSDLAGACARVCGGAAARSFHAIGERERKMRWFLGGALAGVGRRRWRASWGFGDGGSRGWTKEKGEVELIFFTSRSTFF